MKHKMYIVTGLLANANIICDKVTGIPNKTMVLIRPMAEDIPPPTNKPIVEPRAIRVA